MSYQFWANTSLYHKVNSPSSILIVNLLSFVAVFALIAFSKFYRGWIYKKNIDLDEEIIDLTDYSVYVTNIPVVSLKKRDQKYYPTDELKELFEFKIQKWVEKTMEEAYPDNA